MADRNSNGKAETSQLDEHLAVYESNEPLRFKMKALFQLGLKTFFIFSAVMVVYFYSLVWLFPEEPERLDSGYIYEAFEFRENVYTGGKPYLSRMVEIHLVGGGPGDSWI
jgi:hypothetical protein